MALSRSMNTQIASVPAPSGLMYRIAKYETDLFEPAPWRYVGSNRFDDPEDEFRVIYCATDREATFGESLSRLRRSPTLLALMQDVDDDDEQIEDALEGLIDPSDVG